MNRVRRLGPGDALAAQALFALMATVFEEDTHTPLGEEPLAALLARDDFWALAAFDESGALVGGLSAHVLPSTRAPGRMVFLYDIAVLAAHQRRGHGRALVQALRAMAAHAGIDEVFVAADNEDDHALECYRALGGRATPATFFDL